MFLLEEFSKVGNPNFRISGFHDDWDDSRGAGCKCYTPPPPWVRCTIICSDEWVLPFRSTCWDFEFHGVFQVSNPTDGSPLIEGLWHFVTRRHVYQSARGALGYETQRSRYDTRGRAETKSRTPAPMPLLLCKGQMGRRTVIFSSIEFFFFFLNLKKVFNFLVPFHLKKRLNVCQN